jgi:hypothetical protein
MNPEESGTTTAMMTVTALTALAVADVVIGQ